MEYHSAIKNEIPVAVTWMVKEEHGGCVLDSDPSLPREGNGNPFQYSCLENAMDRGAWQATVYGVTESDTPEQLTHTLPAPPHPTPPRDSRMDCILHKGK